MRTTAELREGFLAFFESKGHRRHPSGSLIPPAWDQSTLLNSAGVQPLMRFMLGQEPPPAPLLATAQKVFRTPDIDEVGLDGHHLTFFEMLGNFSFGQYFKDGAVDFAWEFLFDHLNVDLERLWVSVFAGDAELGLGEDQAALAAWERVGMPRERIVRLPRSQNFWSVGGPGPCGPDTEMYYDRGEELSCGNPQCGPGCTCERYLEFWNLVFMEYELHADGTLTQLPAQNVDTGLGLERAASVLQDVVSVYETDGYQMIMNWIASEAGVRYGESERTTKAHRILADHGRGMTFLVSDGVTPSNEGRGYVLRRVIRRAVQQARAIGLDDLWRISGVVVDQMHFWYPELEENREQIQEIVRGEEERFTETLARGMKLFDDVAGGDGISGADAFRLHDTYGFPLELTRELAGERGIAVDEDEFTRLMGEQRERSRGTAAFEIKLAGGRPSEFVGYEKTETRTAIVAYEKLEEDGLFQAKLEQSPFYPEGGGQVSDAGYIEDEETGARAELVKAVRVGDDQVLTFQGEGFGEGTRVRAVVPWSVRFPTMANHTATHLLHRALRQVLGDHVSQAGSAVRPDKLRFDFTHAQALTSEQREEVERRVNEQVFGNSPVRTFVTTIEEARSLGATMLFGEKYGEDVRVVEIPGFSRELCGGTHVRSTAEIGPFMILSESSIGSGTRRIEALTSGEAFAHLHARAREADGLRADLGKKRKETPEREPATPKIELPSPKSVGGVNVLVHQADGHDAEALLELSDRVKQKAAPAAIVLGSSEDGKVHLVANFDPSLEARGLDASKVVREAAALVGGGGGGRPSMARAGGKNPAKLPAALAVAEQLILSALE